MLSHPLKPIEDWIFRILYFFSRIKHYSFQRFNVLSIILTTRSLGALRAPTSSWRPFGPLDFVLRALRALRPCDPRAGDWIVC